jgi:hypothetical protein
VKNQPPSGGFSATKWYIFSHQVVDFQPPSGGFSTTLRVEYSEFAWIIMGSIDQKQGISLSDSDDRTATNNF